MVKKAAKQKKQNNKKELKKESTKIKKEKKNCNIQKTKKQKKVKEDKEIIKESDDENENQLADKKIKRNTTLDLSGIQLIKPPKVQSYKHGNVNEPKFTIDYTILKNCVLQATELGENHNKYYALELHESEDKKTYRLFTHYGRTDDLETNPNAGQKETRFYNTLQDAWSAYNQILQQKTGDKKGYQPVNLISTRIGSEKAVQQGIKAGIVDKGTQKILEKKESVKPKQIETAKPSSLPSEIQELINDLFSETVASLTSTTNIKVTEYGLQTPLGVLTMEQLNQADECLEDILNELKTKNNQKTLQMLSNKLYMLVPQKLGRSSIKDQCINDQSMLKQKRELVEFMKDCLEKAESKEGNVLYSASIDQRYKSIGCEIKVIKKQSKEENSIKDYIQQTLGYLQEGEKAEDTYQMPDIQEIFEINRKIEQIHKIGNEKLMYHGTKVQNLLGILTRGILLPKAVTSLGISRTVYFFKSQVFPQDFGWLGAGIYFGDVLNTAEQYSQPDQKKNFYVFLANVALGNIKDQKTVNESLRPPAGVHTMHGNPDLEDSEFEDHEFCIYRQDQFYLKYLVKMKYNF